VTPDEYRAEIHNLADEILKLARETIVANLALILRNVPKEQ
jgi:hypothetical protein